MQWVCKRIQRISRELIIIHYGERHLKAASPLSAAIHSCFAITSTTDRGTVSAFSSRDTTTRRTSSAISVPLPYLQDTGKLNKDGKVVAPASGTWNGLRLTTDDGHSTKLFTSLRSIHFLFLAVVTNHMMQHTWSNLAVNSRIYEDLRTCPNSCCLYHSVGTDAGYHITHWLFCGSKKRTSWLETMFSQRHGTCHLLSYQAGQRKAPPAHQAVLKRKLENFTN